MKSTKEILLKLQYYKSEVDEKNGIYRGGVVAPKYLNELSFNISNDYDFDLDTEEFTQNGMYMVEISGTSRALKEFGKFLINMAMFKTKDEGYHEHIDFISNRDGKPSVNIIVRKWMDKR